MTISVETYRFFYYFFERCKKISKYLVKKPFYFYRIYAIINC